VRISGAFAVFRITNNKSVILSSHKQLIHEKCRISWQAFSFLQKRGFVRKKPGKHARDACFLGLFQLLIWQSCFEIKTVYHQEPFWSNIQYIGRELATPPANNCTKVTFWFVANCTLLMHNCSCTFVWRIGDRFPELWESDFNMKTNFALIWLKNYWTRLSQNIMIYMCLPDRLIMFLGFWHRQMIDSHSADNSINFAQPHPIFVKSFILTETLNVLKSSFVYLTDFIFNQHGTFSTHWPALRNLVDLVIIFVIHSKYFPFLIG